MLEKAYLDIEGGTQVKCLYNPETLSLSRSNQWQANPMPGKGVPSLKYVGSDSGSLKLDLVFDTTDLENVPVTVHTNKLVKLMDVDPKLAGSDEKSQNVRPPTVTFRWGDMHSFVAVVTSLSLQFTYFSSAGLPLRAKVSLDLKQYSGAGFGPQNPTSGTPHPGRTHRLQPGETLDRVSAHYYGDATKWRLLADANGLHDPLALRAGRLIDIPRLEGS